jgi:diaminobutyrate-2-oxoglutarate transaminase
MFVSAKDSHIFDDRGNAYIDFFSGAGALNYGHNNARIKAAVLEYLNNDGFVMGLDFHSKAKKDLIDTFQRNILAARGLDYKLQFTSPTGTSVVESAIKLARKYTGRQNIVAFTNAFHGMTGVSLSVTGNKYNRQAIAYGSVTRLPYDGYLGKDVDSIAHYRKLLEDASSGFDLPAGIIVETVQGEGGINICSPVWLKALSGLAEEFDIPLIVDDVQAGCGRTGHFFSFERADIRPDMICLSKSIGAMGLPMALLLLKPELDVWSAGEDNGTFRGNNLAFVAAAEMLEQYWQGFAFEREITVRSEIVEHSLLGLAHQYGALIADVRGIGLMHGIEFFHEQDAKAVAEKCFELGLVIETCGPRDEVLKLMPALTVKVDVLKAGLHIIERSVAERCSAASSSRVGHAELAKAATSEAA